MIREKIYCALSFLFGTIMLVATIYIIFQETRQNLSNRENIMAILFFIGGVIGGLGNGIYYLGLIRRPKEE